jgi:aryl carrier-like protein
LQQTLARILRLENTQLLEPQQNLLELGLDSLLAFEARNQLSALLGRELPATLLYDHPTIEQLAAYDPRRRLGRQGIGGRERRRSPPNRPDGWHRATVRSWRCTHRGQNRPSFVCPRIAGTVQPYAQLAARLGPGQPGLTASRQWGRSRI